MKFITNNTIVKLQNLSNIDNHHVIQVCVYDWNGIHSMPMESNICCDTYVRRLNEKKWKSKSGKYISCEFDDRETNSFTVKSIWYKIYNISGGKRG